MLKKILCVINTYKKNGPSKVIKSLATHKNKEYEISVLSLFTGNDEEEVEYLKENNCKYYSLNLKSKKAVISNFFKLKKFIENSDFDIIHTHGIVPDFFLSIMKIKAKKVTTIHNNLYEDYKTGYGLKSYIMIPVHLWAFKKMDKCVCCGKSIYDVLKVKLKNACFVRNGIGTSQKQNLVSREELGIKDTDRVYLYVGMLSKRKNILELLQLFKENHKSNEVLLILGDGDLKEDCFAFKSKNIRFLGFINNPEDYMNIGDVYISASKSEGFSISVLEALQNNCYLLLSDIPAHKECFEISEDYYIGETFNTQNFNKKIENIRKNMKIKSKEKLGEFQNKYLSNYVMAEGYIKEYKELLKK